MKLAKDCYDVKALKRYCLMFVGMAVLLKVTAGFGAIVALVMALAAVGRRRAADLVFWVLFMTATSVGNYKVLSTNFITLMTVRATLMLLSLFVLNRLFSPRGGYCFNPFFGLIPYLLWEAAISIQGFSPIISYLKLILFTTIFCTLIGTMKTVDSTRWLDVRQLRSAILTVVLMMVVGSIALIPFPGLSMMARTIEQAQAMARGEMVSLFCGMCSHSQALGPVMAVLGTFLFADLVFSIRRWDPLYLFAFLCCPYLVYRTSSRTGMGSLLAGVFMVGFLLMQSRGVSARWKGKVVSTLVLVGFFCFFLAAFVPAIRDRIVQYALKFGDRNVKQEVSVEGMLSTRQALMDRASDNFHKKPFLGNGFQVSDLMVGVKRSGFLSYLVAPIEKGVWFYAIPEEGGVPGMILFSGWLVCLFFALNRRKAYVMASTFFAFIMTNTGEFTVFAMTYMGGFLWAISLASGTLDSARRRMIR